MKVAIEISSHASVRLSLWGKVSGGCLGELRRHIHRARSTHKEIEIDLSEVTLVDRQGLEFLIEQQSGDGVRLTNCPEYIQPWFARAVPKPTAAS